MWKILWSATNLKMKSFKRSILVYTPNVVLFATALMMGTCSTMAIQNQQTQRRRGGKEWSSPWQSMVSSSHGEHVGARTNVFLAWSRPSVTICEAKSNKEPTGENLYKDAADLQQELSSSPLYERMNPPLRMLEDSHAVGQMLRPDMIEQYEIYKRLDSAATSLNDPNASANIVTAMLKFGDSLDGHPGVVHGGILALVLDDIFGFSYEAIGVPMAVTANLNLDYRAPLPAGSNVLIQVQLDRRDNRKLFFKAEITSLNGDIVYTEATCLYIIPRSVWESMQLESGEIGR